MSSPSSATKCVGLVILGIQSVSGGKVNVLGGHSIGQSKQKKKKYICVHVHASCSERFPR
jgi:hypothetical protein